jgi:hypothetical protein
MCFHSFSSFLTTLFCFYFKKLCVGREVQFLLIKWCIGLFYSERRHNRLLQTFSPLCNKYMTSRPTRLRSCLVFIQYQTQRVWPSLSCFKLWGMERVPLTHFMTRQTDLNAYFPLLASSEELFLIAQRWQNTRITFTRRIYTKPIFLRETSCVQSVNISLTYCSVYSCCYATIVR